MALPKLTSGPAALAAGGPSKFTGPLLKPGPDPLADVEYTGDLAADSAAELSAMEQAYRARAAGEAKRFQQATDSEYWVCVVFDDRAAKDAFLAEFALAPLGNKYLIGSAVVKKLRGLLGKK